MPGRGFAVFLLALEESPAADFNINAGMSPLRMAGQFLYLILIFGVVVLLAYYATKWIAKAKQVRGANANLRIMDSLSLGAQGSVHLIQAGEQYILVGVTKEQITYLTKLDPAELVIGSKTVEEYMSFDKVFRQIVPRRKDKE